MDYVSRISRKIYLTRKSRIEAAGRLESNDSFAQFILVWYSVVITGLSIWIFFLEQSKQVTDSKASLILLIASIILTICSVFISSQCYKERAIKMKYNYISIDVLYKHIQRLLADYEDKTITKSELIKQVAESDQKYTALLNEVENQTEYDHLKAISSDSQEKMSGFQKAKLVYFIAFGLIIRAALLLAPIIICIFVHAGR